MNMRKIVPLAILFVLLLTSVWGQNPVPPVAASDPAEFTGEYVYSNGYIGAEFKITGDSKYEYSTFSDCCDPVWKESGSFALQDDFLHFKVNTNTLNGYNMLDLKQAAEAYRAIYKSKDADVQAGKIQTEYDMQIVRWGGRRYLLEPDRVPSFTAAVNFGIEPRQGIIDRNFLTYRFFLRRTDAGKPVVGKPLLPEPWISYLQGTSIKANITKIELQNQKKLYTVNKGSADGIKVGMFLTGENTKPEYDDLLTVISVEENSATLKSLARFQEPNYQSGSVLLTKTIKN